MVKFVKTTLVFGLFPRGIRIARLGGANEGAQKLIFFRLAKPSEEAVGASAAPHRRFAQLLEQFFD